MFVRKKVANNSPDIRVEDVANYSYEGDNISIRTTGSGNILLKT